MLRSSKLDEGGPNVRPVPITVATAVTVLCLVFPSPTPADYEGSGSAEHRVTRQKWEDLQWVGDSVASVKENASVYERLHRPIVLRGRIVEQLGPDRYQFEDTSGSIRIDADPGVFPSAKVDENTLVDVIGNVDVEYVEGMELDVAYIRVVSRQ